MTYFLLRILDLFKPIYVWQGIDYNQLRAIVGVKLEMDNRRPPSFRLQQNQKEQSSSFVLIFFIYGLFGAFLSALIGYFPSVIFSFSIYHSYLMVMITLTLISDFSAVLLDTSDNTIVLPRPITPKTFYAARTTHILLYIVQIGLALALIPIVVTFFVHGVLTGVAIILTTILTVILSVALTNGLYLLMMRFTSEEKLKAIVNYFQIGMAVLMMGGYQLLPRMLGSQDLENVATDLHWWSIFIPPMWMAGMGKMLKDFTFEPLYLTVTALAIIVPVATWKLIDKYLTPYFTTKIADLGTSVAPAPIVSASPSKPGWVASIGNRVTKPGLERAAFSLVTFAFARDRKLKLRIYPAIGYFVVMIIVFTLQSKSKGDLPLMEYIMSLGNTERHLFVIYACIYVLLTASFEIHFSDEYKAAWVFNSAPIQKPGELLVGTLKGVLVKFFVPLYAATSFIILLIWREKAIVDLAFGFFTCMLLMLIISVISDKYMPQSMAYTGRSQAGSFARAIIIMLMIGVISAMHYFLTGYDMILWLAIPVLLASCYFILRVYRNVAWDDIKT
ncbi:hypothetical protein WSM22_28470 [Cytophagales bacterium WSM2-2]|nr:hypothetical protein WSM22_28470 [Cytophagales bacterium WSM2-2]